MRSTIVNAHGQRPDALRSTLAVSRTRQTRGAVRRTIGWSIPSAREATMLRRHLQSAATITAIAAVALSASSGLASARSVAKHAAGHVPVKTVHGGTTAVGMEAFPTGGKGSGTEEVCHQWTIWLNEDQEQVDNATTTVEILDASDQKHADIDAAMDAGCAVID
jgi:hypothetical protein